MNDTFLRPFTFKSSLIPGEIWIMNFIHTEYLSGLRSIHLSIVTIEAIFCTAAVLLSIFLAMQALQHPPVHMNLVLITVYHMSWIAMSNAARVGLILFEAGVIPFKRDDVPVVCLVLSFLRLYGLVSITHLSIFIYVERCLALRYVRDYECNRRLYIAVLIILSDVMMSGPLTIAIWLNYLPGYKMSMTSIVPYFFFYFAIKNLCAQNELRLDHLNHRQIRRPSVSSGIGKFPKKFFGDSSKDMYTLSLRLQLDENIWCCRQLGRSNFIFLTGIVSITLFVTIPPLLAYTNTNIWVLMVFAALGNLFIPVFAFAIKASIAWSLDKMKPLIVPAFVFERYQSRKRQKQLHEYRQSGRVSTFSQIEPDSESRYSRETNEYFSQLSSQWDKPFESLYI